METGFKATHFMHPVCVMYRVCVCVNDQELSGFESLQPETHVAISALFFL